jgi:hypothetical protein
MSKATPSSGQKRGNTNHTEEQEEEHSLQEQLNQLSSAHTGQKGINTKLDKAINLLSERVKQLEDAHTSNLDPAVTQLRREVAEVCPSHPLLSPLLSDIACVLSTEAHPLEARLAMHHPFFPRLPARLRALFESTANESHTNTPPTPTPRPLQLHTSVSNLRAANSSAEQRLIELDTEVSKLADEGHPAAGVMQRLLEEITAAIQEWRSTQQQQQNPPPPSDPNDQRAEERRRALEELRQAEQDAAEKRRRLNEEYPSDTRDTRVSSVDISKFMSKPALFSGKSDQDVDLALAGFENYLSVAAIPLHLWPVVSTNFLRDDAYHTWMHAYLPAKNAGLPITWAMFTTCLQKAYGLPNKELTARRQFKNLRQRSSSAQDYVQHAYTLLSRIQHDPPSESDKLHTLFDGLHPIFRKAAPVHPMGRPWATFDELANHIITLEQSLPNEFSKARMESAFPSKLQAFQASARPPTKPMGRQSNQSPMNKTPPRPPTRTPSQGNGGGSRKDRDRRDRDGSRQDKRDDRDKDDPVGAFMRLHPSEQRRILSSSK